MSKFNEFDLFIAPGEREVHTVCQIGQDINRSQQALVL